MLFRLTLRPSPLGFAVGLLVIAFWALLWIAFFAQVLEAPENASRQPGAVPELARAKAASGWRTI